MKEGRPITIGLVYNALSCIVFHLNEIEIEGNRLSIQHVNNKGK